MPTPGALRPIQRVPSGLPGPGGTGFSPLAHGELGGYHHGLRHLTTIWKRPSGVGYTACPVATWNVRHTRMPLYSVSRFEPRRITITGPIVLGVTGGSLSFAVRRIVERVPCTSSSESICTALRS